MKHGIVYHGKNGKPLGRWAAMVEPPWKEMEIIKGFLLKISKQTGEVKMSKTEQTNMCFIAGTIKSLKQRDRTSAFLLIDVGESSKYVPCTIYEEEELLDKIDGFREGDFIQIQGFARAWSQKKNDEWRNSMDIRITHIKNIPPKREEAKAKTAKAKASDGPFSNDDGFPF